MNIDQVRADHQQIIGRRESTVLEWLEDVRKRDALSEPLDMWEPDAVRRVLPYMVAAMIQALEVLRAGDELPMLHDALQFLKAPVGWLRDG